MFNVGSQDKEKLKENMKEIKNMIDSGAQEADMQKANQELNSSKNLDDVEHKMNSGSTEDKILSDSNSFEETSQSTETDNELGQEIGNLSEENSMDTNIEQKVSRNTGRNMGSPLNRQRTEEVSKEERSSDVGAEKRNNTLFLKVDRFERVKETIKEMKQLSSQIEGTMENLETGLEQDEKTQEDTQSILQEFKNQENQVQNLIETEENN